VLIRRRWIMRTLALLLALVASAAAAAQPLPLPQSRTGSCPWGYLWSGGQCIPSGRDAPKAVPQVRGSCPSGWVASGGACVKDQERAPPWRR
jgi:hypothetical protein